jgi:protein-S-isoprenylcysteine O-methyltransferase Ste14
MSLGSKLVLRVLIASSAIGVLLFIPAGSLRFWQGWAYGTISVVLTLFIFLYFYKHDPKLVERRLRRTETVREQKIIMKFFYGAAVVIFGLPGIDHRLHWSHTPLWLTMLALALVFGSYLTIFWVMKVNTFAASTIQVEPGQTVISSGPYHMVRHPMYLGACVMLLFTPLALGSYFALPAFVLFVPVIIFRLLNEEKVLRQALPGYSEYCHHTRFRLLPRVW